MCKTLHKQHKHITWTTVSHATHYMNKKKSLHAQQASQTIEQNDLPPPPSLPPSLPLLPPSLPLLPLTWIVSERQGSAVRPPCVPSPDWTDGRQWQWPPRWPGCQPAARSPHPAAGQSGSRPAAGERSGPGRQATAWERSGITNSHSMIYIHIVIHVQTWHVHVHDGYVDMYIHACIVLPSFSYPRWCKKYPPPPTPPPPSLHSWLWAEEKNDRFEGGGVEVVSSQGKQQVIQIFRCFFTVDDDAIFLPFGGHGSLPAVRLRGILNMW